MGPLPSFVEEINNARETKERKERLWETLQQLMREWNSQSGVGTLVGTLTVDNVREGKVTIQIDYIYAKERYEAIVHTKRQEARSMADEHRMYK